MIFVGGIFYVVVVGWISFDWCGFWFYYYWIENLRLFDNCGVFVLLND